MRNIRQQLLTNWHAARVFRFSIGVVLLLGAIYQHDGMTGLLSAFFLYQGITDTGCCGTSGCSTPGMRRRTDMSNTGKEEIIDYEEIK